MKRILAIVLALMMVLGLAACGAKTLKVNALLRVAVLRYRLRPEFIKLCASLFKLPVTIAGVVIR